MEALRPPRAGIAPDGQGREDLESLLLARRANDALRAAFEAKSKELAERGLTVGRRRQAVVGMQTPDVRGRRGKGQQQTRT